MQEDSRGGANAQGSTAAYEETRDRLEDLERRLANMQQEVRRNKKATSEDEESCCEEELEDLTWLRKGHRATYPPRFLLPGEREADTYQEKLFAHGLKMDFLPRDASGLHGWMRALFTQLSPLDKSAEGVLFKSIMFYIQNGYRRDECAYDTNQGGLPVFSKHLAKAVTSTAAMATSPDLAIEIEKVVATAVQKGEPILMGPVLSAIGKHCSFKKEAATGVTLISFLQLRPASLGFRDVGTFIRVLEQKMVVTPVKRRPTDELMFAHLWQPAPQGCGFQGWAAISEEVREIKKSSRRSSLRTFGHLLKVIKGALDAKREERNLVAVQNQLIASSSQGGGNLQPTPLMVAEDPGQETAGLVQYHGTGACVPGAREPKEDEAAPVEAMPVKKGEGKNRSGSAARRAAALTPGAKWPLDEDGKQKKIADFTTQEKKTVFCMFERRTKGSCLQGNVCEFCNEIPEGKFRETKGSKKGGAGKGAAKTAAAASALASSATGGQGEK